MIKSILQTLAVITLLLTPTIAMAEGGFFSKLFSGKVKYQTESITIQTASGPRYQLDVEVARTPKQQSNGLMHRKYLDDDSGMLFLFGAETRPSFWMRNTLIPLDMIFINKNGKIVHIHSNAIPLDETRITTPIPASAVLEINGGQADAWGIKEDDTIFHEAFRNILAE